jgi:hypothetical protein
MENINVSGKAYSDDQLAALLGMEDLNAQEKQLARQQAMTQALRGSALQPSAHKDVGSQLARGLQGAMAGYGTMQDKGAIDELSKSRTRNLGSIRDALMTRPNRITPADQGDLPMSSYAPTPMPMQQAPAIPPVPMPNAQAGMPTLPMAGRRLRPGELEDDNPYAQGMPF